MGGMTPRVTDGFLPPTAQCTHNHHFHSSPSSTHRVPPPLSFYHLIALTLFPSGHLATLASGKASYLSLTPSAGQPVTGAAHVELWALIHVS